MKTKCIEVSHIYGNEKWGIEQELSLQIGMDLKSKISNSRLSILVDDYHSKPILGLPSNLLLVDHVGFEGSFTVEADKIISEINENQIIKQYFKKENKYVYFYKSETQLIPLFYEINQQKFYTCALLSFAWHCARSGMIESVKIHPADELISILPIKYKTVEKKVEILIKELKPEMKIEWIWF